MGAYVSKSDEYTENEQATGLGRKPELIVVRRRSSLYLQYI